MIKTNDGRVHIAEPVHVNSSPPGLTTSVADEWSKATDLISINPGKLQGFDQVVATNSILMLYTKACHDNDATLPEKMYSHHWTGTKMNRRANKNYTPPVNIMQPDEQTWRDYDQAQLLATKKKYPLIEAVFNDTARATFDIGGVPVVKGTKRPDTRPSWNAKLKAKLDQCDTALGYKERCLNGLAPDTIGAFTPCIGMVEAAFGPLDHILPTEGQWLSTAGVAWDSQAKGWTPWLYVKMNTTFNSAEWKAFRSLSLPTAMLVDRGSLVYCMGAKEGQPPGWSTGEYKHPWYQPRIGTPSQPAGSSTALASYRQASGVYAKAYTEGVVLVNPTAKRASALLPDGTSYPLNAASGEILRADAGYKRIT